MTTSSTARIKSFRISISHSGCKRTRTSPADSATMRQGIGTWHWRITTRITTGLPNQEEYTGEMPFVPWAIKLDSLLSLGIEFTGCACTCSAAAIENLSKFERYRGSTRNSDGHFGGPWKKGR